MLTLVAERTAASVGDVPVVVSPTRLATLVVGEVARPRHSADVGVVVVTHNSVDVIDDCLTSLLGEREPDLQVVVVDNASTDGTAELVAAQHPWVTLIRKARRSGFGTNCNIGSAAVRARHVLLLNPDTVVSAGAIQMLVAFMDEHPEVGVAAPRLVYRDGRPQASARRFPTLATAVVRRTPLRWIVPNSALERHHLYQDDVLETDVPSDIDWALGAALLVRTDAFNALVGFDDGYRLYCEDADLCWRAHVGGWAVRYVPQSVIAHDLGEHTRRHFFTIRTVWHLRGVVRFAWKHGLRPPAASPSARGVG